MIVLASVLVACGGGGDDEPDEDAATTTSTTAASSSTTTTTVAEPTTTTTSVPVAGSSPEELAAQIETAETSIRDEGRPEAGHLQQVAYRALSAHPEWDAEVRALLPPALHGALDANVSAARELRSLVRNPRPNLPAWRIVPPEPAADLRAHYEAAEAEFGVPWQYLAAVHLTETRMGRIRGTSTAGAQGPMQFLPSTWEAYGLGGDIESNRDAILGAANYLKANGGADGRMDDALYRYNPTPKYVKAVTLYAERMIEDPLSYRGYWGWQVYYWSTLGDVWLRHGWTLAESRPVTPEDLR